MTDVNIKREDASNSAPPFAAPTDVGPEFPNRNYTMPSIYAIMGVLLFATLFMLFDTYITHLKIETSIVTAPIETMEAPATGTINQVFVSQSAVVKKGTPLIQVENLDMERDLELARVQASETQLNLDYLRSLLANEQQKSHVYQTVRTHRMQSTRANVEMAKQEVKTQKNHLERMRSLHKQHYVTDANLDEALSKYKAAEGKLATAETEMSIEHSPLNDATKGLYFTGDKIEGQSLDLTAQVEIAQKKLQLSEERVKVYEGMRDKLILRAPFDGKVIDILKSTGNTAERGKPLITIEQTHINKRIVAYLTQDEIIHVGINGKVRIYIPAIRKTFAGKVAKIDRTDGLVDELKAQYLWHDLESDRSAMVIVDIDARDASKFNQKVTAGMPAIVYFSRKYTL